MNYHEVCGYVMTEISVSEAKGLLGKLKKIVMPWESALAKHRYVCRDLEGHDIIFITKEANGRWFVSGLKGTNGKHSYRRFADAKNAARHRLQVAGYHMFSRRQMDKPVDCRLALLLEDA